MQQYETVPIFTAVDEILQHNLSNESIVLIEPVDETICK